MAKGKLSDEVKTRIVQALACFDTPSDVARLVKEEFDLDLIRQHVEAYDPTKAIGRDLSKRWRTLFEQTRKDFIENASQVAARHRAVRIKRLERMATKMESKGNFVGAAALLEQIAKEVGEAYTNRRVLTGANGKPLFPSKPIDDSMTPQEAADAYAASREVID